MVQLNRAAKFQGRSDVQTKVIRPGSTTRRLVIATQIMWAVAFVAFTLLSHVSASAFSYRVKANENACFYTYADKIDEKISFYFSVNFIAL